MISNSIYLLIIEIMQEAFEYFKEAENWKIMQFN
jgi:hypothetical protein